MYPSLLFADFLDDLHDSSPPAMQSSPMAKMPKSTTKIFCMPGDDDDDDDEHHIFQWDVPHPMKKGVKKNVRKYNNTAKQIAWHPAELNELLSLVHKHGRQWSIIANIMNATGGSSANLQVHRTNAMVRNRFLRYERNAPYNMHRKKSIYSCSICGQKKRGHICKGKNNTANTSNDFVVFDDFELSVNDLDLVNDIFTDEVQIDTLVPNAKTTGNMNAAVITSFWKNAPLNFII